MIQLLTQVLVFVQQILAGQLTVIQALQKLENSFVDVAVEHSQFNIETQASSAATNAAAAHTLLDDPTIGLGAIMTALNALGAPQQSTQPVILPTSPPPAYGGPTTNAIALAVWGYQPVNNARFPAAEDIIAKLDTLLDGFDGEVALPLWGGGPFFTTFNLNPRANVPWVSPPEVNPNTILPTDADVGAWLNRLTGLTWTYTSGGGYWYANEPISNGAWYYCHMSQAEFLWYQANASGPRAVLAPPIWPGVANATLGTPVAITSPSFTVTGPMDGILVDITSVTVAKPYYDFDGRISRKYLGQIAFISDNGECEPYQSLGFDLAVYCPRQMVQADHCNIHLDSSGIVGTVTPWLRT